MNIAEWLYRTALNAGNAPALLCGEQLIADYGAFARRAQRIAAGLRDRFGILPGARLAVFMNNRSEYLEVLYGIWWAGAVVVPINAKLHAKEAAWIIKDAEAALVFASDELIPALGAALEGGAGIAAPELHHGIAAPELHHGMAGAADQEPGSKGEAEAAPGLKPELQAETGARPAVEPQRCGGRQGGSAQVPVISPAILSVDAPLYETMRSGAAGENLSRPAPRGDNDLAWLFYTSGTTGNPKGVMLSNGNLMAMSLCYPIDVDPVTAQDTALYAAPLSHGAGLYNFIHVRMGARHVVPASGGFDPDEIFRLAARLRHVSMFAAPTMVRRLIDVAAQQGLNGDGIKTIVYGGGPMYLADIIDGVKILGPRFVQIFGQGESPMTITALARHHIAERAHPRWRQRLGSVGRAQSCVEVRVADRHGRELAAGEPGEVLVKGASVMHGYWRNGAATASALRDGWLWTGDIGQMDNDGFLTLCDRCKDLIISGGSNISPRAVEEALLLHGDVHEAAVVGRPHALWGEEVVAFVVMREGAKLDARALDAHCLATIARFKRPKAYFPLDELPKNNYGKVLKRQLRQTFKSATLEK